MARMSETTEQSDLGSTQGDEKVRFDERLINLLKTNPDFVDDTGELLRDRIKHCAWQFDRDLINLLLTDQEIESKFFEEINGEEINGRWIFNNNTFVDYINDKHFLDNSYTRFSNKIGLTIDNKFLRERGEIALAFPHKDCVLEGGQTREEEKRPDEIRFNELLAQDEINRLLAPKVLTNWKRHTANGEEDVMDLQRAEDGLIRENLLIKGNNLIALHCLQEQFRGQVKLIYIDPPYNTGGEANVFTYNNTYNHSTWLTFMKNRLEAANLLLRDDGFIAITIDHYELFYLGALADEIFGRENRLGIITIVNRPQGRQFANFFSVTNEYMLVYSKNKDRAIFNEVILTSDKLEEYDREDDKGKFKTVPLMYSRFVEEKMSKNPQQHFYPIYVSKDLKEITLSKVDGYYEVLPINNKRKICWKVKKDSLKEILKGKHEYFAEKDERGTVQIYEKYREGRGVKIKTHWDDSRYNSTENGTELLKRVLGYKPEFSYPKSLYAVLDTLKLMTKDNDIILDFFAGSGTTGHAVLELNELDKGKRQFILVEQLEEHVAVGKERLEKVIAQKGLVCSDFLSCELMQYNQAFIDKIQSAQSTGALLDIWQEMSRESFLNWYVKPERPEEAEVHFVAIGDMGKQKKRLEDLLDKNQLYVHLSEIEDELFNVSESDKTLNEGFYGGDDDDA